MPLSRRLAVSCAALAVLSAPALGVAQGTAQPRSTPPAGTAAAPGTPAAGASAAPYTEGTVWYLSFIRTKPGMEDDYLKGLAATWKRGMEEAKKQGIVLSYKIILSQPANRDDWDLLLMAESKSWASLDGMDARMRTIFSQVTGGEAAEKQLMTKRVEMREILGNKLGQEISLK